MKLLVFLLVAGKMFTTTPPQSIAAPTEGDVFAQMYYHQSTFVYAHSYLAGGEFYKLMPGEKVMAFYNDGSSKVFTVVKSDVYIARSTDAASTSDNIDLTDGRVWIKLLDAMDRYSESGAITLMTCYAADHGHAVPTGRLFIELMPEDVGMKNWGSDNLTALVQNSSLPR